MRVKGLCRIFHLRTEFHAHTIPPDLSPNHADAVFPFPSLHAQEYGIELEVVNENIGLLVGALGITDLTGYSSTHCLYVDDGTTADDFVSSVSGDATNPTYVNTSTDVLPRRCRGGGSPNGINSLLFAVSSGPRPTTRWVTIGLDGVAQCVGWGGQRELRPSSTVNPWFDQSRSCARAFPGGSIAIDDPHRGRLVRAERRCQRRGRR